MSSNWHSSEPAARVELRLWPGCGKLALSCSVLVVYRGGASAVRAPTAARARSRHARRRCVAEGIRLGVDRQNENRSRLSALHPAQLRRHLRRRRGPHQLRQVRRRCSTSPTTGTACRSPSRSRDFETEVGAAATSRSASAASGGSASCCRSPRPSKIVTIGEGQTLLQHVRRRRPVRRHEARQPVTCSTRG